MFILQGDQFLTWQLTSQHTTCHLLLKLSVSVSMQGLQKFAQNCTEIHPPFSHSADALNQQLLSLIDNCFNTPKSRFSILGKSPIFALSTFLLSHTSCFSSSLFSFHLANIFYILDLRFSHTCFHSTFIDPYLLGQFPEVSSTKIFASQFLLSSTQILYVYNYFNNNPSLILWLHLLMVVLGIYYVSYPSGWYFPTSTLKQHCSDLRKLYLCVLFVCIFSSVHIQDMAYFSQVLLLHLNIC